MTLNIAHAAATAGLIFITYEVLGMMGWLDRDDDGKRRFRWQAAGVIALVVFIFNLIWPWS